MDIPLSKYFRGVRGLHGGKGLIMPALIFAAIALHGCAWVSVAHTYPSGLSIVRADQSMLDNICSHTSDEGVYIEHAAGCFDKAKHTIWLLNNCAGAQALPHELAHLEGISNPKAYGMNW